MKFDLNRKRVNEFSEDRLLAALEKAALHFNYIEFSRDDFDRVADISASVVRKHFEGSWTKALDLLRRRLAEKGLELKPRPHSSNRILSDKDLFDEMARIWAEVGQRPSQGEWENSKPRIAYATYKKRFGGWTNACLKFIEHKMGNSVISEDPVPARLPAATSQNKIAKKDQKPSSREIPLSVRLKVLNRDNFKCVFCGKSPATDFGTKLHIDHIVPYSKGGLSLFENLQTLCEECNLGKSDKDIGPKLQ